MLVHFNAIFSEEAADQTYIILICPPSPCHMFIVASLRKSKGMGSPDRLKAAIRTLANRHSSFRHNSAEDVSTLFECRNFISINLRVENG
jgi:hypothetical protein